MLAPWRGLQPSSPVTVSPCSTTNGCTFSDGLEAALGLGLGLGLVPGVGLGLGGGLGLGLAKGLGLGARLMVLLPGKETLPGRVAAVVGGLETWASEPFVGVCLMMLAGEPCLAAREAPPLPAGRDHGLEQEHMSC